MKSCFFTLLLASTICCFSYAQGDIHFTNPVIYDVLKGNYDPQDYLPPFPVDDPASISWALNQFVNADSMKATLLALQKIHNRNTGSDTISSTNGIGAARRWVHSQFKSYSERQNNRLQVGYLDFLQNVCGIGQHRNVVAVLPGQDISDPSSIIIEAHLDSRCKEVCDTACLALGMEDNASGVALVLELARVMSGYVFNHTIVFMTVIGEEQSLVGSNAFAVYAKAENIPIKAVQNNDIVGGIICGMTSSPPSCPGLNNIDSTQVRLFSYGGFNSPHKALARYIKLEYNEMIKPVAAVPMQVSIMSTEDRQGRGSDHIPFRENGFVAMRFCSANEHGNADVTDPNYHDRQHTSDDILGVDTDGDQVIDSFFVDFHYLARNTVINGNSAAMAALSPKSPTLLHVAQDGDLLWVEVVDSNNYNEYVVGLRVSTNDFDTLYYIHGGKSGLFTLADRNLNIFVSAAAVDQRGVESFFSPESLVKITGTADITAHADLELFQNKPNPFDESTIISFWVNDPTSIHSAKIDITDMTGKPVKEIPVTVHEGMNEVIFDHGYNTLGTYLYSLFVNGRLIATKKMVFAN